MNWLLVRILPGIFKPSLSHSKRSVRLLALQKMDLQQRAQQDQLLQWLQEEQDAQLIQEALQQFPSTQPLLHLLQEKPAPGEPLAQQLLAHLQQRLHDAQTASQLAEAITHPALLEHLINQAPEAGIRLQALAQLAASEQQLLEIALSNAHAQVRHQAATQITREELLETLAREAQGDKTTQRLAREKLGRIKAQRQARQEALEQKKTLLRHLQQLLKSQDQALFAARLEHIERQWQALTAFPAGQDTEAAYAAHLSAAQAQAQQLAAEEEAQRQAAARQQAARAEQADLQKQLDTLTEQSRAAPQELPAALSEQLEQLSSRWQASQTEYPAPATEKTQFAAQIRTLEQLAQALQQLPDSQPDLHILLAETPWSAPQKEAAKRLLEQISWPAAIPAPDAIQQTRQALKAVQPRPEPTETRHFNSEALRQQLDQLEHQLESGQSREAQKQLQQLQEQLDAAPESERRRHAPRLGRLNAQAAELRDWQGFVAAPKRENLCEQMQALAEDEGMEPQAKADRIQALQQEWRELGSAAGSKALWQRFKQAADQAYYPCKVWFAEQAQLRQNNQEQKRIICQELEKLAQNEQQQQLDEEALDQLMTQIHDEWHRFNPVNRSEGKQLAERFQAALTPLKERLQQLRQQTADQKQALIQEAQALLAESDLQAATQQSKELQARWRQLGRAPGSLEHQLWKAFRSACDQLFQKRDAQKEAETQARQDAFLQARQQLAHAREALATGQLEEARQAWQAAKALDSIPNKEKEAWQEAIRALGYDLDSAKQALKKQQQWEQLLALWETLPSEQPLENADLARRLTVQLETLAGCPLPKADQALKMQLQVERLKAGIGSGDASAGDPQEEAAALLKHWQEAVKSRQGELAERFFHALQALYQDVSPSQ